MKPRYYTLSEGGEWKVWPLNRDFVELDRERKEVRVYGEHVHAIRFGPNQTGDHRAFYPIWDEINGFRNKDTIECITEHVTEHITEDDYGRLRYSEDGRPIGRTCEGVKGIERVKLP